MLSFLPPGAGAEAALGPETAEVLAVLTPVQTLTLTSLVSLCSRDRVIGSDDDRSDLCSDKAVASDEADGQRHICRILGRGTSQGFRNAGDVEK